MKINGSDNGWIKYFPALMVALRPFQKFSSPPTKYLISGDSLPESVCHKKQAMFVPSHKIVNILKKKSPHIIESAGMNYKFEGIQYILIIHTYNILCTCYLFIFIIQVG